MMTDNEKTMLSQMFFHPRSIAVIGVSANENAFGTMYLKALLEFGYAGKLYPVNMPSLNKRVDLFIENERVVLECECAKGVLFYLVLVGALNVGKMQVSFEPRLQTNADRRKPTVYTFDDLYLKKGDDFGCFEMGSTIVLITEKETMDFTVQTGQKVRFGDTIARLS